MTRQPTPEPGHPKESAPSPQNGGAATRLKSGGQKLTDDTVKTLRCPEGKKDALFFDNVLKGFGVRVMPNRADGSHRKVFLLQYRAGDKVRREPLGDWGSELTTAQARRKAEALRGAVRDRRDPVGERKEAEAASRAAQMERKRVSIADAFTLEKLVQAWEERALSLRRASYRKEATARVRQGLAAHLQQPAAAFTRSQAAQALQAFATERGPIGANRLMAYARACYGWGIKANLLDTNPWLSLAAPGRERARDRVLSQAELRAIWAASPVAGAMQGAYVRFLMLTLQRRSEVSGAMWAEFAPDLSTWTVPAERAKNGRAQVVPLAPAAQALLKGLERDQGQPLVFALPGGTPVVAFSTIKAAIDGQIAKAEADAAETAGREPVPMAAWTYHDFRRSGVTALAGLGFAPHVCDRLLNHVTGAIQGVAAVYQRAEFLTERKAALEAWEGFVATSS
jgi:integrase